MNISELKKMEDKEFISYITKIQRSKTPFCIRCGELAIQKRTLSVTKDNIKVKKLCTLCENCYSDLLDFLAIPDVEL